MSQSKLHVVFGQSAGRTLQDALHRAGRDERVVCSFHDFSFGPIDSSDPNARIQWIERELGYSGWADQQIDQTPEVTASRSFSGSIVAWVSFRDACSFSGFLFWLSQIDNAPFTIQNQPELNILNADQMIDLLDKERPYSSKDRTEQQARWQRLVAENASLRLIDGHDLVSAPIDYFDPLLLSFIHQNWQKMALIVAKTLSKFMDDGEMQTDDLILSARLRHMAETGVLEWQGDLTHMRGCELRRPPTH